MKTLFDFMGNAIGTVAGVAIAPLAISLDVSVSVIESAVKAGCKTEKEIREWVMSNER